MNVKRKSIMSDLKKLDKLRDEDIDYSDSPELDDTFFTEALVELPKPKRSITIRLDSDIIDWFKRQGKRYQTAINAVLKTYVASKKRHTNAANFVKGIKEKKSRYRSKEKR